MIKLYLLWEIWYPSSFANGKFSSTTLQTLNSTSFQAAESYCLNLLHKIGCPLKARYKDPEEWAETYPDKQFFNIELQNLSFVLWNEVNPAILMLCIQSEASVLQFKGFAFEPRSVHVQRSWHLTEHNKKAIANLRKQKHVTFLLQTESICLSYLLTVAIAVSACDVNSSRYRTVPWWWQAHAASSFLLASQQGPRSAAAHRPAASDPSPQAWPYDSIRPCPPFFAFPMKCTAWDRRRWEKMGEGKIAMAAFAASPSLHGSPKFTS